MSLGLVAVQETRGSDLCLLLDLFMIRRSHARYARSLQTDVTVTGWLSTSLSAPQDSKVRNGSDVMTSEERHEKFWSPTRWEKCPKNNRLSVFAGTKFWKPTLTILSLASFLFLSRTRRDTSLINFETIPERQHVATSELEQDRVVRSSDAHWRSLSGGFARPFSRSLR